MSVFAPESSDNRFEASYRIRPDRPGDPYSFKIYVMYDADADDEHVHGVLRDLSMGDMLRIKREVCTAIRQARLDWTAERRVHSEQ